MFFPPLYLILDAGLLVSELALVWRRRASRAPSTRLDRGSHLLLWAVIVGSITAGHLAGLSNVVRGCSPASPGGGLERVSLLPARHCAGGPSCTWAVSSR